MKGSHSHRERARQALELLIFRLSTAAASEPIAS